MLRRRRNVLQQASNTGLTGRLIGIYLAENDLGILDLARRGESVTPVDVQISCN